MELEKRVLLSAVAIGPETLVNTTTLGSQTSPSIAMDADGDYVVTWAGVDTSFSAAIFAQRYNAAGVAQGGEVQVNSGTENSGYAPAVAMDANGDFAIVWQGEIGNIYGQRFDATGIAQGGNFQVNSTTTDIEMSPVIAMDAAGDFAIAWTRLTSGFATGEIFGQRFDASGTAQGGEFQVNSWTTGTQRDPSIAMDTAGDFVITWAGYGQDPSSYGVYAQRYNSSGDAQGSQIQVNSYTTSAQWRNDVWMNALGDFTVTWETFGQDGNGYGIAARQFDALGDPLGNDFIVNSYTTSFQDAPTIAGNVNGDFVVTWRSFGQDGSSLGVYAQRYNASGIPQGGEFQVNSFTSLAQSYPVVAMNHTGDFVIAWQSDGQDGSSDGTYLQRYRVSQQDSIGVWRAGRFYLDSNHSKTWNGPDIDQVSIFGTAGDKPLSGDWDGEGHTEIGTWNGGVFQLDLNGNGVWDGPGTDREFLFGNPTDTPIVGDWNRDGKDEIGVWRAGKFYLDTNGNNFWDIGVDTAFAFGNPTDTPITGDWNGDGTDDVGIRRDRSYFLDSNGNHLWNPGVDALFGFGNPTDTPIAGDWNGDGIDDVGVWRAGKFYLDSNGNKGWDGSDTVVPFGGLSDTPLIGYWTEKTIIATGLPARNGVSRDASAANVLASLMEVPRKKTMS